jgi:drug/metabolite transporter (DMT)-like permease
MDLAGAAERHVSPPVALAVAVVAVSTSAILVRWSDAPSTVKALYRVVFMTAMVAPVAARRHRADFGRLSRRDLGFASLAGVALAAHFATWFESLEFTSVAASVTLVQTQPLFVAAGAVLLLNERVTRVTLAGILVAILGVAAMTVADARSAAAGSDPLLGNGLAVVGAVMAAGYVLAGRSIRQRVALFPYVTVVYAVCAAALLSVVLVQGHALLAYPPREWVLFLAMAVGPGIFGHTVLNWVLEHMESSVVSVSLLGEPVGSALLALAVFAEAPSLATIVGGAVVLVGIAVTVWERERTTGAPDQAPGD